MVQHGDSQIQRSVKGIATHILRLPLFFQILLVGKKIATQQQSTLSNVGVASKRHATEEDIPSKRCWAHPWNADQTITATPKPFYDIGTSLKT